MMTIGVGCAVVMAAALGVQAIAATVSQDDLNQHVRQYRLTADNLRKMLAVDSELATLAKTAEAQPSAGIEATVKTLDSDPQALGVFKKNQISGRDYLLTLATALFTDLLVELAGSGQAVTPEGITKDNVNLWKILPPDLRMTLQEWKKRRLQQR